MNLPFSTEQFLQVFAEYNVSIYPLQFVFYLMAAVVVFLSMRRYKINGVLISVILSFFWLWMGVVYHILFFADINKAAYGFGALFIIQAILFFYYGAVLKNLSLRIKPDAQGITGLVLVFYALVAYPLIGYRLGHVYPSAPTFGLPCPTTIFTLGVMLWQEKKIFLQFLIIPLLWSVIGFFAALKLGIAEDTGLIIAGIIVLIFALIRRKGLYKSANT